MNADAMRHFAIAFAVSLISVETATAGMIVDNFDDGNADGWVFPFNSGLTQFPGGSWAVENGTLVQHFFGDDNAGLLNNVLVGNQTTESKVSTNGYAGIVLWYQQADAAWANFVSVEYSVQGGMFVREASDGILSRYSYGGPFIGSGIWFELKVEAASASGNLTVYLNQTQLFTHVASTTYRTGFSGVFSGNEVASFDDFQITSDEIVPEPSSLALWGSLGLMALVAGRKRRVGLR